ncbi:MAG: ABC transporter permease subunit [Clostridia bacterium]|nr:ABC transporter permease subunit [Clostridia bacterium]
MLKNNFLKNRWIRAAVALIFWFGVWEILYHFVSMDVLIPSPYQVLERFTQLSKTVEFWLSALFSLIRITVGWLLGVMLGTLFAFITKRFLLLDTILSPAVKVVKATPVASFILLAYVWIETQTIPTFISFLMVLPIVWGNVSEGIESVPKGFRELSRVYKLPLIKRLKKVELPAIRPFFFAACRISLGLAWKAGVAAEVLCQPETSIGSELWASKVYIETVDLFVWTAVVIILSVILEKLFFVAMTRRTK